MATYVEKLAQQVADLQAAVAQLQHQGTGIGYSSFDRGGITQYNPDGTTAGRFGNQADGTNGAVTLSGPAPGTPTTPTGEELINGFRVTWDGNWLPLISTDPNLADTPGTAPLDFQDVEVHGSAGPDFTALLFATKLGDIVSARGGSVVVPANPGQIMYFKLIARSTSGKVGAASALAGPFTARGIELHDLPDISEFTGSTIFWGDTEPTGAKIGDLWLKKPTNTAFRYQGDASGWVAVQDQGISEAIAQAIAAQQAADSKAEIFFQATAPVGLGPTDKGDIWLDSDDFATYVWDGVNQWRKQQIGSGSIQPGSLIARDVIATGTVSAALLEAIMVLANTIVVGDPNGNRISISGVNSTNGTPAGIGIQQITNGKITFNLDVNGGAYFAGVLTGRSNNYTESTSGWIVDEGGRAGFQTVQVYQSLTAQAGSFSSLTVGGQTLDQLVGDHNAGQIIAQGINDQLVIQNVTAPTGIVELGFTAYTGRAYEIIIDGPVFGASDRDTFPGFLMSYTVDGSAPTVASPLIGPLGHEDAGPNSLGQFPARSLRRQFLWYPPIGADGVTIRMLLFFEREYGGGTVGVNCSQIRCQMYVRDAGPALANSMRANGSTSATPPAVRNPVQSYTDTFYSTWGASYRAGGTRWSENETGWAYQGYGDSFNGDQLSLHGFDIATIRARLAGATIRSAQFFARAGHTWNSAGGVMLLGTHGNDSMPATGNSITALKERRSSTGVQSGGWAGVDALGAVSEIAAAQASGFTFGRAGNNNSANYAYFYQYPHVDRPRIVVVYDK